MSFTFLILGAGRSGTSLITALLDTHPQLELGFELFSVQNLMDYRFSVTERINTFIQNCEKTAEQHKSKIWGNKITTEQIHALDSSSNDEISKDVREGSQTFFNQLQNKKIIFILRDGRSCVQSKVNRTGQDIKLACARWCYSICIYEFLLKNHSKRTLFVRYEELLNEPERVLKQTCQFLNIQYISKMLEGTDNPKLKVEYRNPGIIKEKSLVLKYEPWHKMIENSLNAAGYISK